MLFPAGTASLGNPVAARTEAYIMTSIIIYCPPFIVTSEGQATLYTTSSSNSFVVLFFDVS